MKTIRRVSYTERALTQDSAIVRENKAFKFTVPNNECLLHGQEISNLLDKLGSIVPLVERLELTMKAPNVTCETPEHGFHLEFICLLLRLPDRFNDGKIDIKAVSKSDR